MRSGKTLWDEICLHYYTGVEGVKAMQKEWDSLEGKIDAGKFEFVKAKIKKQLEVAEWWRDGCVLYFQQFCTMPIPDGLEKPGESLDFYRRINYRTLLEN